MTTPTRDDGLPEPRLWYDPETQRCSSMAPLRPTYEPLWDEQDMRAAIAAERRLLFQAQEAAKHLAAENKRLHDACASGWGEPTLINTLRAELSALREQLAEARAVPKPAVRTDTARLDMLESDKMMRVFKIGKTWYWKPAYGMPHRKAKTLREAIDAALGAGCARVAVCACDEQGEPGVTCGDCPRDYGHCVTPSPTPVEQTVPWPEVTRYSGGASHEGIGGRVWIRLSDEGPDVEYVPAEQPKPAAACPCCGYADGDEIMDGDAALSGEQP